MIKVEVRNIQGIIPTGRSNTDEVVIICEVTNMKDVLAQICEQMGDEEYIKASCAMLKHCRMCNAWHRPY